MSLTFFPKCVKIMGRPMSKNLIYKILCFPHTAILSAVASCYVPIDRYQSFGGTFCRNHRDLNNVIFQY
jgi:hypothetical protein